MWSPSSKGSWHLCEVTYFQTIPLQNRNCWVKEYVSFKDLEVLLHSLERLCPFTVLEAIDQAPRTENYYLKSWEIELLQERVYIKFVFLWSSSKVDCFSCLLAIYIHSFESYSYFFVTFLEILSFFLICKFWFLKNVHPLSYIVIIFSVCWLLFYSLWHCTVEVFL